MALTALSITRLTSPIILAAAAAIAPILSPFGRPDGTGKNASEDAAPSGKDYLLSGTSAFAYWRGGAGNGIRRRLCENDWLPLLMVDGHDSPTSGSLICAGFHAGMTVGRFTGGWFY